MAKINNITAIAAFIFVVGLLLTLIHPFDFLNKDIETLYHENEGLIWMVGIGLGGALMVMTYINSVFQGELKECASENLKKNTTIEKQNKEIILNQEKYIAQIGRLTEKINDNFSSDNALVSKMNDIVNMLQRHDLQIKQNTDAIAKLSVIDMRLSAIEKKLK